MYGLCAVMHSLVTGLRPPPAPERRVDDPYEPLAQLGLSKYSQEFLRVIDEGLSMQPAERPQSLADLAGRLGMVVYADAVPASPARPAPRSRPRRRLAARICASRLRSAASRYGSACCWRWSSWVAPLAGSSPAARPMR